MHAVFHLELAEKKPGGIEVETECFVVKAEMDRLDEADFMLR
jgi:hypothetical protein